MTEEENTNLLVSDLARIGFPVTNMDVYLNGCIGMQRIEVLHNIQFGNDRMYYDAKIPRRNIVSDYYLDGYKATLLKTHPLPNQLLDGISISDLDLQMLSIDWNRSVEEVLNDPKAARIYNELHVLSLVSNKKIEDAIDRLMLRYLRNTPFTEKLDVNRHANRYLKSHYFKVKGNAEDTNLKQAYNLLSGRSVLKFYPAPANRGDYAPMWLGVSNGVEVKLPDFDLMGILKTLPLPVLSDQIKGPKLIYDLTSGDLVATPIVHDKQIESVLIQADPQTRLVKLFSPALVELSLAAFQLNEVQKYQFDKSQKQSKNNIKNREGRSL